VIKNLVVGAGGTAGNRLEVLIEIVYKTKLERYL